MHIEALDITFTAGMAFATVVGTLTRVTLAEVTCIRVSFTDVMRIDAMFTEVMLAEVTFGVSMCLTVTGVIVPTTTPPTSFWPILVATGPAVRPSFAEVCFPQID